MEIKQALKEVQSTKRSKNYLTIQVSYDTSLVLPYEDGMAFISALSMAEHFDNGYGSTGHITPINRDVFKITTMSPEEYQHRKVAALMNLSYSDISEKLKENTTS